MSTKLKRRKIVNLCKKQRKVLKETWELFETEGKKMRRKGEPEYMYVALFKAQAHIERCVTAFMNVQGALS